MVEGVGAVEAVVDSCASFEIMQKVTVRIQPFEFYNQMQWDGRSPTIVRMSKNIRICFG